MQKYAALLLVLFSAPAFSYNSPEHRKFAEAAAATICASKPDSRVCAELRENLPFLIYGSYMEDEGAKGFREVFNGVEFRDEEAPENFGPCKENVYYGGTFMYCNHYFFVGSYLAGGTEGACGKNTLGATSHECGKKDFKWESTRQRALRLWKEKVLRYYGEGGKNSKAYSYYWLGRVAHLLADTALPAHVMPHEIGYVEFEHRAFEYEAARVETGELPKIDPPSNLDALFVDLASLAINVHDNVRAGECRRSPGTAGCDTMRASPSRPLESRISALNVLFINSLIKGKESAFLKPEMIAERKLAAEQLKILKPLTVAFTAKLLEIFGEQSGLEVRSMSVSPGLSAPVFFEPRSVDFDGASR